MKAISVRQPWAWALLYLGKPVENRDRQWHYRGPLLLHASSWWRQSEIEADWEDIWEVILGEGAPPLPPEMKATRGCLVGRMRLADCVQRYDSPWFFGPWGLVMADRAPLAKPVPFRGALGLFDVPEEIVKSYVITQEQVLAAAQAVLFPCESQGVD